MGKGNHSQTIAYMNSIYYSHSPCSIMISDYLHEYLLLPLTESRQTFNVRYQLDVSLFTVSVYFHDVAEKNKKCWLIPLVCVTSHADRTTLITQRRVDGNVLYCEWFLCKSNYDENLMKLSPLILRRFEIARIHHLAKKGRSGSERSWIFWYYG